MRLVRFWGVKLPEYPRTVNGIEEDQVFSGIMYAG